MFDMACTDPPYLVSCTGRWGSDWQVIEGDSDVDGDAVRNGDASGSCVCRNALFQYGLNIPIHLSYYLTLAI
jgi:hypothetical protein